MLLCIMYLLLPSLLCPLGLWAQGHLLLTMLLGTTGQLTCMNHVHISGQVSNRINTAKLAAVACDTVLDLHRNGFSFRKPKVAILLA